MSQNLLVIGEKAPDFCLVDLTGSTHCLTEFLGHVVMINFWSAECPVTAQVDQELIPQLKRWGEQVTALFLAVNANEPREMIERVAGERQVPLVLLDQDHRVADLYAAQTTPHFFVLDRDGRLRYQGGFNDVTFRHRTATRQYLTEAVESVLLNLDPDPDVTQPYGCAIVRFSA